MPIDWDAETEDLFNLLYPELLSAAQIGGAATLLDLAQKGHAVLGFNWSAINEGAANWAESYTYDLIKQINETTTTQVQNAISTFHATPGMTRGELENLLLKGPNALPGLTTATGRFYSAADRAQMTAVTEVTRSYANGELETMRGLGVAYAEPDPDKMPPQHVVCRCGTSWAMGDDGRMHMVFQSRNDDRVCEICGPLNEQDISQ
jgi:hypothetical protein